jgi:hypothetical protein
MAFPRSTTRIRIRDVLKPDLVDDPDQLSRCSHAADARVERADGQEENIVLIFY